MISGSVLGTRPGPMERTRWALVDVERRAIFRRHRLAHARLRLRESDELLDLIEECRLRGYPLIPPSLWHGVVGLIGSIDAGLRDDLGIDRHPDHVADVVFRAQEILQEDAREERRPQLAPIIPLFGDVLPDDV
ncbi:MAG: hypothetical protein ACR2GX_07960 [Candidatus Dormibacteria bacterium]